MSQSPTDRRMTAASTTEPPTSAAAPIAAQATARRRVLMIAYDFPPNIHMGAQACAQLARHLPAYGWEPVVLTVRERHSRYPDVSTDPVAPTHIIRTGMIPNPSTAYRYLKAPFEQRGGSAQKANRSSTRTKGLRYWLLSLLCLDPYAGWVLPAILGGLRAIRRHRIDHILSSAPRSTNHLVGLALARLTGLSWTAQFRDPWVYPPAVWHLTKPVSALSAWLETTLERMVVCRANVVTCVTDQHTNWFRQVYPDLPSSKFVTVPNGFDGAEWEALESESSGFRPLRNERFVITHAGSLYHRRSPLPLFRALRSLIDAGEVVPDRIQVVLIGGSDQTGGSGPAEMAAACGLAGRVTITGPLSRWETLRRVAHSDLLLLLAEGLTFQVPGKTYEYLRAGRPILALTSEGAVADLLGRTGGAWVVDPTDETGIAAAVREAYRRWRDGLDGPLSHPEVVASFDRRRLADTFAGLFDSAMAGRYSPAQRSQPRGECASRTQFQSHGPFPSKRTDSADSR